MTPPQPAGCGPVGVVMAPFANAGNPQTVSSGTMVVLDGGLSSDPNQPALPLSYSWLQTGGPTVSLSDSGFVKPFFTAPTVAQGATPAVLTFSLVANDFPTDVSGRASFYVGCTRAIEYLEVFAHQRSGLVAEMERALARYGGEGAASVTGQVGSGHGS